MSEELIALLKHAVTKRGSSTSAISPIAIDLCRVFDHQLHLHRQDVADLRQENLGLKARLETLERQVFDLRHTGQNA